MTEINTKDLSFILPNVRLIFPYLVEKCPIDNIFVKEEKDRKYSANLLLSKDDEKHVKIVNEIEQKLKLLLKDKKIKNNPHQIVKDGDEELELMADVNLNDSEKKANSEYKKNKYIITAKNSIAPYLSIGNNEQYNLIEHGEIFYSGCFVHAFIELNPYKMKDQPTYKGVSTRLIAVQFFKKGEKLGSGSKIKIAKECFANLDKEYQIEDECPFGTFNQNAQNELDIF